MDAGAPNMDATLREIFGPDAQGSGAGAGAQGAQDDPSRSNTVLTPNPPEDANEVEPLDQIRDLMAALYGADFPLCDALDQVRDEQPDLTAMPQLPELLAKTKDDDWVTWARARWSLHRAAVEMHLHLVARNRLFRAGQQWVSSKGREPWREPSRPVESARVVHNMIAPALDQRVQVIADQRPGFDVDPMGDTPDEKRKAEARQQALESQYDLQEMDRQTRNAAYWAQTDGVAFWHVTWDRDRGPLDERMGDVPGQKKPLGDLRTQTLRVEQVRVSANATATEKPYYAIVREVLSETEAAYLYGASGIQDRATTGDIQGNGDTDTSGTGADGIMPSWVLTQTLVGEGNRLNNIKTVERFTLYVERHPDILPEGLQLVVVGRSLVWGPGALLFGTIPLIPIRDGSTDPSYYPRPIMEQWIDPQMRVNAALSLWVNSVRVNSGGRYLARPDAISRETFIGSGASILEVEGAGALSDQIMPVSGFLVGQDTKDLISFNVKAFEDMSGYNDVSRGQISNETATAVASANEHIERVFTPVVDAMARAFEDWARVELAGMAWGYDIPRDLAVVGANRPDLARALTGMDFDAGANIRVNAGKLVPMPKIYRLQILDSWLQRGLITPQQYMRNAQFAHFNEITSPDEDQSARAKRVADALRQGQPLPPVPPTDQSDPNYAMAAQMAAAPLALRWQTNEAIEQDILEREILMQDDLPPQVLMAAAQRWAAAAAQAAAKQGAQPGSPQATFQQFTQDIQQKVLQTAESYITKEVQAEQEMEQMQQMMGQPGAPGAGGSPPSPGPSAPPQRPARTATPGQGQVQPLFQPPKAM